MKADEQFQRRIAGSAATIGRGGQDYYPARHPGPAAAAAAAWAGEK